LDKVTKPVAKINTIMSCGELIVLNEQFYKHLSERACCRRCSSYIGR